MPSKQQITGMRGVFLVAAELTKQGLTAMPTLRNSKGADILVTNDDCKQHFSVQVKTNAKIFSWWLIGSDARKSFSKNHIYVFVNIKADDLIDYYVVPSKVVAKRGRQFNGPGLPCFGIDDAKSYKDKWTIFK